MEGSPMHTGARNPFDRVDSINGTVERRDPPLTDGTPCIGHENEARLTWLDPRGDGQLHTWLARLYTGRNRD